MSSPLHDAFIAVLRSYVASRTNERIGRASTAWQHVMSIPGILASTGVVRAHPRLSVRASAGQGGWARIPWVALLHADAATSTRDGVYLIYLFREDMSGVYLTLNQGVTEPTRRLGTADGLAAVQRRAREIRPRLVDLAAHGFELDAPLDLHSTFSTAQQYVASTIAHRLYPRSELPSDDDLLEDLGRAIRSYESLIS